MLKTENEVNKLNFMKKILKKIIEKKLSYVVYNFIIIKVFLNNFIYLY